MKKVLSITIGLLMVFTLTAASAVHGFQDVKSDDPARESILALKERQLIHGIGDGKFGPELQVSFAQGISMIVGILQLKLDSIYNDLQVNDLFANVSNHAWYAKSLRIAHANEFDLPIDLDPDAAMTKEEFAYYLSKGLVQTGDYAFIEIFQVIQDGDKITEDYMNSVQKLLVAKITALDDKQMFHPQAKITRAQAAHMLFNTLQFIDKYADNTADRKLPGPVEKIPIDDGVVFYSKPIDEHVQEVTIDWGMQGNPGYGIYVNSIEFDVENKVAAIYYELVYPDPDKFYPQVITPIKTKTYIDAAYELEVAPASQPIKELPPTSPDMKLPEADTPTSNQVVR